MNKRRHSAVIRFRRYNKDADSINWHRAKLMLYYPWFKEDVDLLGSYSTYEEHYCHVKSVVILNEKKFTKSIVEDIDFDTHGYPEHAWEQLAPSTEDNRLRSREEGDEQLTEVSQQDLDENAGLLCNKEPSVRAHARYESAANKEVIPPEEYRTLMRELNSKQKAIVMYHRNWCEKAIVALRNNQPVKPYRVF